MITFNGQFVVVAVEYQWLPPKCSNCKVFGLAISSCGNKPTTKPPNFVPKWQQQQQQPKWQVVGKRDAINATELVDQAASCIVFGPSFNQCSRDSPISLEKASPSEVEPQLSETIVKNLDDAAAVCKPREYATRDDSFSDSEVEELTIDTGVESLPGADMVLVKASNSEAEINDLSPDPPDSGREWKTISYEKKNNSARKPKELVIMGNYVRMNHSFLIFGLCCMLLAAKGPHIMAKSGGGAKFWQDQMMGSSYAALTQDASLQLRATSKSFVLKVPIR